MSMHVEFPGFTPKTTAAFHAAVNAVQRVGPIPVSMDDFRRALAASLREAVNQATDPNGILFVGDLQAIANNLHSPPPPPPTLTQALGADLDTYAGKHLVRVFLATLREGAQP